MDVGKTTMFAVLLDRESREVLLTFKWDHLTESRLVVGRLRSLPALTIACVMEPSGTYGDPLRELLWRADLLVYRVSPKRCHDFAEVYDGVPSHHDAKSAVLVAHLHASGISELWPQRSDNERALVAAVRTMAMYDDLLAQARNRVEAQLSRHWPELEQLLELDGAVLLELVAAFGSPAAVAKQQAQARELMSKVGGRFLAAEKVDEVLKSAQMSIGVPMIAEEQRALQELATEARSIQKLAQSARRRVERLARHHTEVARMGAVVGLATAAVLVASAGNPLTYPNAASWLKSLGLNLKERSSGLYKGRLRITKRGPSLARKYQFLAMVRWLKDQPLARAWYDRKVQRDPVARKALVALMRKSARALWWVAKGEPFDAQKLFDASRLAA
jgi:transposase